MNTSTPSVLSRLQSASAPTTTVEFLDGMKFTIRYTPKAMFSKFVNDNTELVYNPATKQREPKLNSEKFALAFLKHSVLGWEGVTMRALSKHTAIDINGVTPEQLDELIPFDVALLRQLVDQVYGLDQLINGSVIDMSVFRPKQEAEVKN